MSERQRANHQHSARALSRTPLGRPSVSEGVGGGGRGVERRGADHAGALGRDDLALVPLIGVCEILVRVAERGDRDDRGGERLHERVRKELSTGYMQRWGAQLEKQIQGPFVAGTELGVADLKLFTCMNWLKKGVLDYIPDPACTGRQTIRYSVGGAEASRNGLSKRMPVKTVDRSAMGSSSGKGYEYTPVTTPGAASAPGK